MGLKSSCAIFEKFSTSLEWLAVHHLKVSAVLHILDDFLFIAHSHDKCKADLSNFLSMCDFLGVPFAHEKTLGLLTTLQFGGIELDSVRARSQVTFRKDSQMSRPASPICAQKISLIARTIVVNWPIKLLLFRGHSRTRLFASTNRSYRGCHTPPLSHPCQHRS